MRNKFIHLEKLFALSLLMVGTCFYTQIRIANSATNQAALNSSAFIDASSNTSFNLSTNVGKGLLYPRMDLSTFTAFSGAPIGIPNSYPYYYDGFMVYNTASSGVAGVGSTEGTLCRGFWYYDNSTTSINQGTWRPFRPEMCSIVNPIVTTLNCSGATHLGTLTPGAAASGVSTQIPYTGGNGSGYPSGTPIASTGVTGLTATLQAGTLANGNGTLTYTITGTPSGAGTASFSISFGGHTCSFTREVTAVNPIVTNLNCGSSSFSPVTITQGEVYTGTLTIPYTGGNGDSYSQMSFTQNGLTFTLPAGTLATGADNLVYNITGTPMSSGMMSIPISFGSQSCSVSKTVSPSGNGGGTSMCMGDGTKVWASYNLGADPSLTDPNPPVITQEYHGNYYQWGRADVVANADTPPEAIAGWNTIAASNGAWNSGSEDIPVKTAIDPCPSGFRVPTQTEWAALVNNSTSNTIGTFNDSPTNFGAARQFTCPSNGNKLTLPAAGYRGNVGALSSRSNYGYYWSSTNVLSVAYNLQFSNGMVSAIDRENRIDGFSVRCIAE
ncbi:FISUMP domain-containing protein [Chryseobacterium potabilaquae]|uniref:Fibrobacter succinogenes major paralogous domain-containing protein n=1 Tax=Chryseobacterium potabilaquae TaxID=2675057 RepID=A0A6N4XAR3_9FLAO|nr:FISUMP domain-containing protein [Chryseobacterium potabilaquae]CAA7196685.1 hypothetical protein CHRY9293_02761 [Chryseobacterium potabilaquae]